MCTEAPTGPSGCPPERTKGRPGATQAQTEGKDRAALRKALEEGVGCVPPWSRTAPLGRAPGPWPPGQERSGLGGPCGLYFTPPHRLGVVRSAADREALSHGVSGMRGLSLAQSQSPPASPTAVPRRTLPACWVSPDTLVIPPSGQRSTSQTSVPRFSGRGVTKLAEI